MNGNSSLNRPTLSSGKEDERKSALLRGIAARSRSKEKAMEIVRAMPAEAVAAFEALDYSSRLFKAPTMLALIAANREAACRLLALLPPTFLVRVQFDSNERGGSLTQTWPVTYSPEVGLVVRRRQDIAPFMFSIQQGPGYGPKHQLLWATKLGGYEVAIQTHIASDTAQFELQTQTIRERGRMPERRYKWEPGKNIPDAPKFGRWGRWSSQIPDATATVYWPLDGSGGVSRSDGGYMQAQNWSLAARFLLCEEEAQG